MSAPQPTTLKQSWPQVLIALAVCLALATAGASYIVSNTHMENQDFFSFWAAGKLVLAGLDPYDELEWLRVHQLAGSTWLENPTFVYPLPVALLFAPLAVLPFPTAATVWLVLSQMLILGAIALTAAALEWRRARTFIPFLILSVGFFRPTIVIILNGQFTGLPLFATAAAMFFWSRGRWFWGGAVVALTALKPTSAIVFLPAICLWLLWRRQFASLAGLGLTLAILWSAAALVRPDWLLDWIAISLSKVAHTWSTAFPPTAWGWLAMLTHLGHGWTLYAAGVAAGAVLLALWITSRTPVEEQWLLVIGVVMPAALLATPYLWTYEYVMLVAPIVAATALLDKADVPFAVVALIPFSIGLVAAALLLLAVLLGHDAWGWLLPATVALVFSAAFARAASRGALSPAQARP
jgi:hypothetical protein